MTTWKYKIKLKDQVVFDDQDSDDPSVLRKKAEKFWVIVKSKKFMKDFVDEFEVEFPPDEVDDIEIFNSMLTFFYDYCDWNYIWVD